jgi:hypothetical protein
MTIYFSNPIQTVQENKRKTFSKITGQISKPNPKPQRMKTFTQSVNKAILAISLFIVLAFSVNAQQAPRLSMSTPVLLSGKAGTLNAVYKYSTVATGVDAYITILSIVGGAKLDSFTCRGIGNPNAWEPAVDGPGTGTSYIKWSVAFRNSSNQPYTFSSLTLTAIDIDGDGSKLSEFIQAFGLTSYNAFTPSSLTVTKGGDSVKAVGPTATSAGIDTSAWNTEISFNYINTDSIIIETGAVVKSGKSSSSSDRFNCIYFQPIGVQSNIVNVVTENPLPVTYLSFDAALNTNNTVILNWITTQEINNNHFEIEQSFDNSNFKTLALVLDGMDVSGSEKSYQYKDNSASLEDNSVVYYRLKQVDNNGNSTYSKVVAVKLNSAGNNVAMRVYPNPFVTQLNVTFTAIESGNAVIRIVNMAGQTLVSKQTIISKGNNSVQVTNLGGLPKGMYAARLIVNGMVINTQKIVKN